jgi:RNA polymerase sigma factor (sigma-70 family)
MRRTNLRPIIVREIDRLISSKAAWMTARYGLQPADTQDIRQEGWVAALKAIPGYTKAGSTMDTYLAPYVTFAMLDAVLKAQAKGLTGTNLHLDDSADLIELETEAGYEEQGDAEDAGADIAPIPVSLQDLLMDDGAESSLLDAAQVEDALNRLAPRERNLLVLYFGLNGQAPLTIKDLARRNRQNMSAIYRRIQRGIGRIKADMEQHDTEIA